MPRPHARRAVLVTGGAGFIGAHLVRRLLGRGDRPVVVLDALTYAGHLRTLEEAMAGTGRRAAFVHGDVADPDCVAATLDEHDVGAIYHLAAETHVDRSWRDPEAFQRTNVEGARVLLAAARARGLRIVHVGTDEVYGSLAEDAPPSREDDPLDPTNPYSRSKAAADVLCLAAHAEHGQEVVLTRGTNTYGPWQYPEKLVPVLVVSALAGRSLPLYGDGLHRRAWLAAEDHADGLVAAMERGRAGRIYHLGPDGEPPTNLDVARLVLARLGLPAERIAFVPDRPHHDRRYALDATRARDELGWTPRVPWTEGLARTVDWYRAAGAWCAEVCDGAWRAWWQAHYGAAPEGPSASRAT